MKKFIFGLLILGFSSASSAALMPLVGDGIWGTVDGPYDYCDIEARCLSAKPATTPDPSIPNNDTYPAGDNGWYLYGQPYDAKAGLYFQPEFGFAANYQSLIDGLFLVKTVWRGLEGVNPSQENTVFTLTYLTLLNVGDIFWLDTTGIAINANAFVFMSIKQISEVPVPATFFLLAPVLLAFMRWREKNLNS